MKNRKPRADGGYVINVSFTANETSLVSWADMHGNFSSYVKQLIKADMEKKDSPTSVVEALLLKVLQDNGLKVVADEKIKAESVVDKADQEPQEKPKPKVNKSKILGLMKTDNK